MEYTEIQLQHTVFYLTTLIPNKLDALKLFITRCHNSLNTDISHLKAQLI